MNTIIIIPAYNEVNTLPKILKKISSNFFKLVIDDCSSDNTYLKAKNLCDKIIRLKKNSGVDKAINAGFNFAIKNKFKYIITIDADGQHDPRYINQIETLLKKSYDLVITQRESFPRFSEKIFSIYTNYFYRTPDLLSGMKGFSYKLAKKYGCYDTINSIGTELAVYGIINRFRHTTIKIRIKNREDNSRLGGFLKGNLRILKALKNLYFLNR
jgi:glycosyltransferase involved in cell wall biosynthesis